MTTIHIKVFDGAWFNAKYAIENDWKDKHVVLLFPEQVYPHTEEQQLSFPLLDMLKANMEYKEEDYASFMQQYNLPEKFRSFVKKNIGEIMSAKVSNILNGHIDSTSFSEDMVCRASWQIKNFMEFALMLINTRSVDDLKLNLFTNEEEDKIPDLIDKLDDIKDDLATYGIEFTYKFRDFHDRCIKTDTGWTITLGRGLDMFEKYSLYSIASSKQDMRKCKEFTAIFIKNKNV